MNTYSSCLSSDSLVGIIKDCNLSRLEIFALFKILSHLTNGNQLEVSQADIMREIGSNPSNSSRIFNKFRSTGILIKENDQTFVNPHVMRVVEELAEAAMNAAIMGLFAMREAKAKTV